MQLVSVGFAGFWLLTLAAYYLCPKFQWQILLVASLGFYILYAGVLPIVLIVCAAIIWMFGYVPEGNKRKWYLKLVIFLHVLLLLFFKLYGHFGMAFGAIVVPVGLSFFSLAAIGYCIDVHWERCKPEKNYAKLLLFLSFFPSIIQGPINRWDKLSGEIFKPHIFSKDMVCRGIQRFIWGLFKKLILVDRLLRITESIFECPENHSGLVLAFGVGCFAVELYADFSGYMDMVIGIGQTFGIGLPENFKRPYFSETIAEFWRRWHITLGTWFKDYVMYGFVMSPLGRKIGKSIKKRNKQLGKLVPTLIGTMLVWGLTGLWHGTSCGYLLWGVYYGVIMCISLCMEGFWTEKKKGVAFFKGKLYKIICILRTCFLVFIADILICAGTWDNIKLFFKKITCEFKIGDYPALYAYGRGNAILILFGVCLMLVVSFVQEKYNNRVEVFLKPPFAIRWLLWYILIFVILLFGTYGAGYEAMPFMYQVF